MNEFDAIDGTSERSMKRRVRVIGLAWIACLALLCVGSFVRSCSDRDGHMASVFAQEKAAATYRTNGGMALPDADVTPGAVDKEVWADPSKKSWIVNGIEKNICAPHFSATAIRKTIKNFPGLKKKVCEEYGVQKCDAHVEGDHLISIEIGGCPDCLTNLWPQPMGEARVKDHQVEDVLPKLVCAGKISLKDAQKCIATDWVACEQRIKELR
jgi:hypothetical protein